MLTNLPETFGGYAVARQWIPKAMANRQGAPAPRPGKLLAKVSKIVIGDTGRRGLTAADAAKDLAQAYGHFLVDDKAIIECAPALTGSVGLVEQACFVRSRSGQEFDAQECAIAVNLCFGGQIKAKDTYAHCVALVACVCDRFKLDPSGDMRRAGDLDIARKDPDQALLEAGADFQQLLRDVTAKLESARALHEPTARPNAEAALA